MGASAPSFKDFMYKRLKALSMNHLGKEFKRIWNEIVEMKQSIAEIKEALIITTAEGISENEITVDELIDGSIGNVSNEPEEIIADNVKEAAEESTNEPKEELTELERVKLKAESLGIKVHHKAKIESIQMAIDKKENA